MKVGIVIPTITGRDALLEQTLAAYEASCPVGWEFDVTIPEGYESVGAAWNAGADDLDADWLHFGIDDAEPHAGWAEAAVDVSRAGMLPAARILRPDGELECCGSLGAGMHLPECESGTPCRATGIPFMHRNHYADIGRFLDIHYYVDDDYYWRAAKQGYRTVVCRGYCFTHNHKPEQRVVDRWMEDMVVFISAAASAATRSAV